MAGGTGVEVELAIARGDEYLHKARFRPSNILTVGTNPMTAITLEGDGIPDFLEFLNVSPDEVLLRFTRAIQVEVLSGSQVLATAALIDGGYARPSGDAFGVVLEVGGKAVVRLGPYKLMLKVDPASDADVVTATTADPTAASCSRCGTLLRLVLAGGGALTPCAACGALNRVTLSGTKQQQIEDQATRIAMPTGVLTEPPPEPPTDQLSPRVSVDPDAGQRVDPGSSTGRAISDLPTFDAISVLKEDDSEAANALRDLGIGQGGGATTNLAGDAPPAPAPSGAQAGVTAAGSVDPGSTTGREVSDLPTFDAIAVLKEESPEPPRPATVNLAGEDEAPGAPIPAPPAAPPAAPPSQPAAPAAATPAPEPPRPAPQPAPAPAAAQQEVSVSETPSAPGPTEAPQEEFSPTTGQWEETLTIQAVKPKPRSMLPWIILTVLAFLGLVGLAAVIVAVRFLNIL